MKTCLISLNITKNRYSDWVDSISHSWYDLLSRNNLIPYLLPNDSSFIDYSKNINKIDLIILTGGKNKHEYKANSRYQKRDELEYKLIDYAINKNIPILGICRGMQTLNLYFNGSISLDKNKNHVNNKHEVLINKIEDLKICKQFSVNSYHNYIITDKTLGQQLQPFAYCKTDNTIEGFYYKAKKIIGIAWHPERDQHSIDSKIIQFLIR
tara:strand:+ start:3781 stop:4410 length:630 start_codon:yes stop_codon:yes gene_type:complete